MIRHIRPVFDRELRPKRLRLEELSARQDQGKQLQLICMDDVQSSRILGKIGLAILAVALADLFFLNYWIYKNENLNVKNGKLDKTREIAQESSPSPLILASPSLTDEPSLSPPSVAPTETKTVIEKQTQTIVQTAQKEIFVPMGSGSSNSNTFADLFGVEVTIDTSKYGAIDSVVFEASLWVEGGNGQAVARIRNVTDNNPYVESQISNNSGTGTVKTSGKIPFPLGQKTYRVQAKTDITNFAAHVENARLKITLK